MKDVKITVEDHQGNLIENGFREAAEDMTIDGIKLQKGDRILLTNMETPKTELDKQIADVTEKQADGRKRIDELKTFDQMFTKQLAKLKRLKAQEAKIYSKANEIKALESSPDVLLEITSKLK